MYLFLFALWSKTGWIKTGGETAKRKEDRDKCVKKCLNKYKQFKMNKGRHEIES